MSAPIASNAFFPKAFPSLSEEHVRAAIAFAAASAGEDLPVPGVPNRI
jgi:uncharacterized protein (DUF433 family)